MTPESASPLLIDTDVHPHLDGVAQYLPRVSQERWKRIGLGVGNMHEGNPRGAPRRDALPPRAGSPAATPPSW